MIFVDSTIKKEQDPVTNGDHKIKEEITTPLKNQRSDTPQNKFDYHGISKDMVNRDNNNNETNKRTKTSPLSLPVSVSNVKSSPITPVTALHVTAHHVTSTPVTKSDPIHHFKIKEEIATPQKDQRFDTLLNQHKFDCPAISKDVIRDSNNNKTNKRSKKSPKSLPVSVSAIKSAPITPVIAPTVAKQPSTAKAPSVTSPLVTAKPVTALTVTKQQVTAKASSMTAPHVTAPPVTTPPATAPTVAIQQVTAKAPSVAVPPVTALPVTAPPVTAPPVTVPPVTATPVTAPPVTATPVTATPVTATPVTVPTIAKQPVTAEASGQGRLVAYQQPGVITVTLANSSSASGIQISTSTSNNNFPTSPLVSLASIATTSSNSESNMSSSADQLSRPRVHLKPIRKGQSNADNTPPSNRNVVWPLYQHVWRSKPWTNFTSFNQTTSTQSRKRKASDTDDGHQQQAKSAKETEESRPGGATQNSGPNCHIAASPGVTGVKDTTVPMLEIHRKTKRKFAVKIRVPSKEYPWVNYPGKLIGVKGTTIKQLERLTRCKLTIRGKGCFSSRTWEEQSQEDLHILVECFADTGDAYGRFARAIEILQEFIKSDADPVLLLREIRFQPNYCSGQVSPDQVSDSQVSQNWQYWQPNYNNYTNYTRW